MAALACRRGSLWWRSSVLLLWWGVVVGTLPAPPPAPPPMPARHPHHPLLGSRNAAVLTFRKPMNAAESGNLFFRKQDDSGAEPKGQVSPDQHGERTRDGVEVMRQSAELLRLTPSPARTGQLVFFDDFSSPVLDTSKWIHDVTAWGRGFTMWTPEPRNSFIKNGILHIRPTFTADAFGEAFLTQGTLDVAKIWGRCTRTYQNGCLRTGAKQNIPPIMSARIYSKAFISHGRVEVVARLPRGDWLWPAIWLLPDRNHTKYGGWPESGEIDIVECRGNTNLSDTGGKPHGIQRLFSTIHFGPMGQHSQYKRYRNDAPGHLWSDAYHTYSVDWTADHIRFQVDGYPIFDWSTPKEGYFRFGNFTGPNIWSSGGPDAPFDGKFQLILNVDVGSTGNYFNDRWVNLPQPKPWQNEDPLAAKKFWDRRRGWQATWNDDDIALRVKSVKMFQY